MPDKYYIDSNNNIRVVPEGKEQKFITKYPGSREATNKELSDFENKRAEMQSLTSRGSNIQNGKDNSTAKTPANKPLSSQNTSFVPNQFNLNIPNYAEEFAKNKPELSLTQPDNTPTKIFSGNSPFVKTSKDSIVADAMKKVQDNRRQDTDYIVQSAIDEYESYKKWIDEVNRDPEMSESIKKGLNDWYNQNFRDTNNATDDVCIPSLVKDYLENNKSTVPTSVWVQGSSMFGGGHYAEGTKQDNTPEQMAMIVDFLVNSPKGRMIMEDEKLYLKRLDDNIDQLEKDIRETSSKRNELTPKNIGMKNYLMMSKRKKEEFTKEREAIRADIEKQYPFGDLMNSQNQLNELKKLREAYNDGDKGAIKQVIKEFGRRLPYDLANAGSLGTIGLTDQSALSSTLENPKNVLTRKGYNLVNEYQQAHELDRSIAQDIVRGTTQTLPFITQFVATGGITSAAGKGVLTGASRIGMNAEKLATIGSGIDKTSRLGKGLSKAGNISRITAIDILDAGARSLMMPNTYAYAFARSIDNPGSYLDNFTHSWFVNTIENYSEKFGAHLPGIGFKNPKLKKIMDQTGIQGFPEEFAEEQLGTILNAAFDTGEAEWSDLVDPRNQLITAGTIGLLQIPYASVSAGGYAAGKYRDIKQKRSIRKGYNSNLANMNNVFGEESEALISTINQIIESDNSQGVGINSFIANVASDAELTDKEKDAVFKYTMSYVPYSALNQSKQEDIQQIEQQTAQLVEENANPQMNAVVSATIAGVEGSMQIVGGNIVQREDGSIDKHQSDEQIFYVDADGNRQVTSIDFVESVEENIPTQDAITQVTEQVAAPIIAQQQNEEVRVYQKGEIVRLSIDGVNSSVGKILGIDEQSGNYIVQTEDARGIQQELEVEPREIINEDNIQGVDNGSLVQYRNEKGEVVQGTVNDAYGLRTQGIMDIDGNIVSVKDVIGLVEEEEQLTQPPADMMIGENGALPYDPNVSNSQESTQGTEQNEQSVTTSPSEQNNLLYIEQIPKNESGNFLFEQVPIETTIGALNEVYNDNVELLGVVDATISNVQKQIDKAKAPKPTGDINKDIANKRASNQQLEELNNRLAYWNDVRDSIQQSKPIAQRITEQLTGERNNETVNSNNEKTVSLDTQANLERTKKPTPFQRRLNAVEENIHSVRDRILFGIASGTYKFQWKDKGASTGLASELGLSGSDAERKARIGILSNNGYTPISLAHRIWEETGMELDDHNIRSEVIDVLSSVSSRKQALEALENNAGITEEQYQQQQVEASEYELELRAQEEALISEALGQLNEEDLLSLRDKAIEFGATEKQLNEVFTSSDYIDLIEQLEDGQESDTRTDNEEIEVDNSEGNKTESTQQTTIERNRSEESTGNSRQDSDSTGNGINLSPEEHRFVNEATAQIDADIAQAQKEFTTQQKELSSARKRLSKAQSDTQVNLSGSEQQSTLFDVPADLSKENAVDNILSPIQQQIDAAQTNLDTLTNSRDAHIQEALDNYRKQGNLSKAEVSTPVFGAKNKLVSIEEAQEIERQIREELNNLNSGVNPKLIYLGTRMAVFYIEGGVRKFADFASTMVDKFGEKIKPHLKSMYMGAMLSPGMEQYSSQMDSFDTVSSFDVENLSTFEKESNTSKINSNETNSDKRSDNSIAENGGISTGNTDTDVRERTTSTQTDGRTQSEQRPAMETESVEQRERSDPDRGNNAESSGTELRARGTERSSDNRRKDTADTEQSGKPLNTNNNRQSREENVVPRGNTAKINANIAAIKLAKRLIETGKKATPEQMNVLRRYTGWGGLSSVFQTNDKNYKALQDLLTEDEYDSARASTTTAFYTPSEVTASVWDMIEKLGFKGGNILEPSAGIGNFFALMPENISNVSQLRGVELDTVSGSILKLLYPDANINISGFEKQRIANNSMDLVVSNVPFGNFKVYDSNNKDISTQFDIHDYFIAKSIRTLKAGGIGVFITTSSTLDKSASLRNWLINSGNADFIDAVRLNTDTFKNDAGTEATADIIIVRKRDVNGISPYAKNMQDSVMEREATYTQQGKNQWGYSTGEVEKKARMVYNKYFLDNPTRMAGEMKFGFEGGNAIRPTEQRLAPVKAINQQEVIGQMIDELPSNIYNTTPADKTSKAVANDGTKEGGLTIIEGQPYIIQYNEAVPVDWNSNKAAGYPKEEVLQDYLDIKEGIDLLLEAEHNNDANIATYRKNLNKVYDNFAKKYGTLNENRKINFLQDDIDFPSIAAIENIEDGKDGVKIVSKSDIFSKRVIDNQIEPKADNVEDAVRVSMNQNGKVDIPYIAQLLDKTNEEVQSEIVSKRIGFVNPETGLVEARSQYLSGNVRDKLSIAQQANQENEYDSNIEELSKVIPADIPINLIKLTLGSTWVPTNVYEDFFKETFDVGAQFTKTSTDKYIGKFSRKDNAKDLQMGMPEASGSTLALNSMNNATTTISMQVWEDGKRKTVTDPLKTAQAAAKQSEIAETFEAWVKQNKKYHEELENIYNNTFNAVVNSTVDVDSFDRFPGVGGKVVSLGYNELDNGKELHQYRVAKENTEADNELVAKEAKSLGLDYNADTFAKKLNGTAKILRQHQKEGVIRGLESATLLANEVGTGKTLTLITTAMEMRRLGLAKKPTIVVQRSTYKQFVKEIKNQYPNAKVLAPSAKDLTAKQREQLFAKIAYNDWDIVVLYHSYLDSIPDNPQRVAQYIDEKIQEKMDLLAEMERAKEDGAANAGRMMGALKKEIERLERDRDNTLNPEVEEESDTPTKSKRKRSVKDIEKVRSNAEAKAEKSLDRRTDNTMTFEQLGIDALLIDEAHTYKKLGFVTSLQRVKGIDTAESKRAQSTRLKSSYILENHNGKNIVLATGTPISNTMAEMWTFMRYLYPRTEMGRLQMNNFDAFVNNFGSIEESAEFGSNGKFRITNRFSSYSNVPELIAAWRQVAHTVLTEEVSTLKEGVGTPRVEGGKPADIMLEQTPPLKSVMKAIKNELERFDKMTGAEKKENSYIPLVMFGLAKRAAIDVRLVDPNLPDHPDSKLNQAVRDILQDLKETDSYKGTIAIFCDSYQSSDKSFNVFIDIKQKLVDNGIPAEQVAIINDYVTDISKEKLFELVNRGNVRVVMGTTERLGVGVNIQERLFMAGHLDAPLRPSDYQQRNGRIIRQGNTHLNMGKPVRLRRWGVKQTLDVTGYQRLEIKKKFIDQIMKGDVSQRMLEEADIESTDSSNFNQMMATLSGSQAALALSIEQNKLKKLQNAKQYHKDNQVYMAGAVRRAKGIMVGNGQAIERFEDYKKELSKLFPEGKVTTVSIGKVSANTPEDIDALLSKHITKRIDKEAADLREDFLRENAIIKTSMLVDGIKIDLEIEVKRNYDIQTNKTRVTREIHYTTPNNRIENPHSTKNEVIPLFESKAGANVQNVIDEINDLLSGYDIDREIQRYKIGIDKAQRDIDAYEPQIGQSFAKESELKSTEKKVEDLYAQMEVELQQIEAEEAKENVEAIDISDVVNKNVEDPEDDPAPPSGGRRQTSSSGNFQSIPAEKFDQLVDKLIQTGLAVDVVLNEDIRNNPKLQDAEGNVYGYVTPEGVVYLDATRMNANTPIHEFGHLWNSFTKENNVELYNRGAELVKESEYWQRVNDNPSYRDLSDEAKLDEALAMAIGDKGELIFNRNLKQQFVDWLSKVWQSIKRAFAINTNVSLADMTLSDFTDRAVQDLLRGERLTDTSVQSEETRMQSVNDLAYATDSTMTEEVRNQLDSRIKNFRFRIREAWEDRHLAVKEFLDTLRKNGVDIAEYNDYHQQATHINGKIDAQLEYYYLKYQKPLNKAIADFEKAGFDFRAIENYAILKHGLERNEWMRQDAINQYKATNPEATQEQIDKFAERLPDDYSGITAVQEEIGMSAEDFISEFEKKAGNKLVDDFWKKVKAATTYSLQKQKEGGLIDKKTLDELTSRYEYYIPLRGHDAEVAEDRWDYSPNMGTYFVAPLIKAKGRKTRSESPFAYIFSMAQSSINSANRNWLNQTMLRLARKDTTGLMSVSQSWYVMDGMNADGIPTYKVESPTFSENPEQYRQNIEEFEQRMQNLSEQGFAYPRGSKLNIGGMFIKRSQADQHEIHVWQNGKEYTVYINANPAVAQAINGVNAKDLHKDLQFIAKVSRQMAANFTTRNPLFVATNFSRDYIFASSILAVKEDAKYALQFQLNIPRSAGALQRYIRGKADLSKKQDQYLVEYIMNGAKTGFSHILELNNIQKKIEKEIKKGNTKNTLDYTIYPLLNALEGMNEFAENLSRLSVYITSREQERSIIQSVSDAKEVTVNFNRSGAGGYGAAWFRSLYLFVNANIQALSNFAKVAQKNKAKTAMLISSYAMTGILMPILTALIGGDDGLDEYMKLSDWERQNNLCIYTGSGFIKIPLSHELRVFHAMGDIVYQTIIGQKDATQSMLDIILAFADLIPANPMGAIQGSWADIMPDATKPFFQLKSNRSFTGSRIVNEWADPNKPGYLRVRTNKKGEPFAPAFLVKLAEKLDNATAGDGVEKGLVSFNPDVVNHLMRGYFGGLYSMGMQGLDLTSKTYDWTTTGEFKLKSRETPLKTFYTSESDLMTTSSGLSSQYSKIADNLKETERKIKGYQEQLQKGDISMDAFAFKIKSMEAEIEKYNRLSPYMKQIKKYKSALKDLDGKDQKQAEIIISDLKKQVLEINSIGK